MIKLNTLRNTETVIGQLCINGKSTLEVVAVQYNTIIGLNSNRHWNNVLMAGDEFSIIPIRIVLKNVGKYERTDIEIPAVGKYDLTIKN